MAVRFTLGNRVQKTRRDETTRQIDVSVDEAKLDALFTTLSKRHPDLAPILEDCTHQSDVEILVNNRPVSSPDAANMRVHDGDTVSLIVKAA